MATIMSETIYSLNLKNIVKTLNILEGILGFYMLFAMFAFLRFDPDWQTAVAISIPALFIVFLYFNHTILAMSANKHHD